MKRKKSISALKKELDKVFNAFIRKRDSKDGFFTCISCGQHLPVRLINAGHFIPKSVSLILRWDKCNVNGQCVRCNLAEQGNQLAYSRGIVAKYGQETLGYLESIRHNTVKFTREELEEMIKQYKA